VLEIRCAGADETFCWCWRYVALVLMKRSAGAGDTFPLVLMKRRNVANSP
jgi:hypothetical protein